MRHFGNDKKFMHMIDERTGKFIPLHSEDEMPPVMYWIFVTCLVSTAITIALILLGVVN